MSSKTEKTKLLEKGEFYIVCTKKDKNEEYSKYWAYAVEGFIDNTNEIGYYKGENPNFTNPWRATDLLTGCCICSAKTRKQCIVKTQENLEKLMNIRANLNRCT